MFETRPVYSTSGTIEQIQRGKRGEAAQVVARYEYESGCLVRWHDAMGAVTHYRYDAAHRMVQATDRRGYSFHWEYDANSGRCMKSHGDDGLWGVQAKYEGSTSSFTEPDGGTWIFKHYPDGVISHVIDPYSGVKQYLRDESGRITKQIEPGGLEYTWLYNPDGKHIGRRDAFGYFSPPEDLAADAPSPLAHSGPTTQLQWLHGRPLLRALPGDPPLRATIRRALQDARPAAPRGTPALAPTCDGCGRVVAQPQLDGSVERFQRDPEGNIVVHHTSTGSTRTQDITSWNKIQAQGNPSGSVTHYGYSHRALVNHIEDGNANRTDYVRDRKQRVSKIVLNGATQVEYLYDQHGSVVEERDGQGRALIKYEINKLGLQTSAKLSDGDEYSYKYDGFGNFSAASSSEHDIALKHTGRRRTHDLRDGLGVVHSFRAKRLESTTLLGRFETRYSSQRGTLRIETPDGSEHAFWLTDKATVVRKNGNGTWEATLFDAQERLTGRVCWLRAENKGPQWETRYVYNARGELLRTLDSGLGATRYTYDTDGRLAVQHDPDGSERRYRYDHANNLSYTPYHAYMGMLPGNLVSYSHAERYEHDERGRLVRRQHHDGSSVSYRYDSASQLIEARFGERSEEVWRAAYDGLGRRLWREVGEQRTEFYWDGDRLAAEVAPDGALRSYVYANEDALSPFMWLDYASVKADPASGVPHYLFCAPTGMPLRVENQAREVVWQAAHVDAYGMLTVAEGAKVQLRLRFAGHFHDEHTQLFYNRFRDYDPALGRYLQPDPLGHAGGLNLYAYASNPLVYVDLRGLAHKAKPGAVPMDQQNGSKRPTGTADDPAVKTKREAELTPRDDLPRGEDGLITRQAAKAECERLAAIRRQHMDEDLAATPNRDKRKELRDKQGPCIAVTMDRRTGETFHGHNDSRPATKETKRKIQAATGTTAVREGKPPKSMDPTIEQRVGTLEGAPRELNDEGRPMSNPGSHAEVHSTNAALQDRNGQPMPQGKEAMPELTTVQQPRTAPVDMPCCPNCSYITHGTDQASGVSPGDPPP